MVILLRLYQMILDYCSSDVKSRMDKRSPSTFFLKVILQTNFK